MNYLEIEKVIGRQIIDLKETQHEYHLRKIQHVSQQH